MNKIDCLEATGLAEICIDLEHITISVDRFGALVAAEVTMDMLKRMYLTVEPYNYDKILEAVFGPRKKGADA